MAGRDGTRSPAPLYESHARREFTLCRAALRALLCRRLGCANAELSFETLDRGKPFAVVGGVPSPVGFSVSHSGGHGLIALVPHGRIGVDVEERTPRRNLNDDIRLLFAPGERAELEAADGDRKTDLFYRLWTLKEAVLKAAGLGLALDTAGFEIPRALYRGAREDEDVPQLRELRERRRGFRLPGAPGVAWKLETLEDVRFAAALAREMPETVSNGATPTTARRDRRAG